MKVSYKKEKYDVSFIEFIKVLYIKLTLVIIRSGRALKRLISYAKPLIVVVIGLALYIPLIFLIDYHNQYCTICDTVWEMRNVIFTVLVLAYFINATSKEREYRNKMRKRHNIYCYTMFDYEASIIAILKDLGINEIYSYILYTSQSYRRLDNQIEKLNKSAFSFYIKNNQRINKNLYRIKEVTKDLLVEKDIFCTSWDTSKKGEMLEYYLDELPSTIERIIDKTKFEIKNIDKYSSFIKDFNHLSWNIFQIIEYIRRPWRCDFKKHEAIIKIIYTKNKKKLEKDYYVSILHDLKYRSEYLNN